MPLTKENRHLLELSIFSFLKLDIDEATSKDIYNYLKSRGFLALRGTKQVSMICSGFERRGAFLSRWIKVREKRRIYRKKSWRINPAFYEEHPNQTILTFRWGSLEEIRSIRKRRIKAIR